MLAANYNRRPLSKKEWKNEFLNPSTGPVGLGLNLTSSIFGCYSFEPKENLPIKVIVLDNTQKEEDFNLHQHGYIDNERYEWLVAELDKGQAEGKLMIIAAHIPLVIVGYVGHSPVSAANLIAKLHEYPNFVLWISGHIHRNKAYVFKSPDKAKPELAFWHVETSSLRDFPQQFRTFEIVRNSDNTISIFATNIDPVMKEGSLTAKSRSYAIAEHQIIKLAMDNGSYNAELIQP